MNLVIGILLAILSEISGQDLLGCGGFVRSSVAINYSKVDIKLFTKQGSLKYQTDCAPNNGYYLVPIYDKGDYILKVEPPKGWIFEPTSVSLHIDGTTDPCSQSIDLNFLFKGFSISGQVVSDGSEEGPAGVSLSLLGADNAELLQEFSQKGGQYTFNNVLTGDYRIKATHPKWKFSISEARVVVDEDSLTVSERISVAGYDVGGQVTSEGQPIKGVYFVLFSNLKINKALEGCVKSAPKGFEGSHNGNALCHVASDHNGAFAFPLLPVGDYTLVPFYSGQNIKFEVSPSMYKFTVHHNSVTLQQKFEVQGFSVSGLVSATKGGRGVPNAAILVNGKKQTETNSKGVYHLNNMKAGSYNIRVEADQIYFDPVTVNINPNTPDLPEITASAFDVCGQAVITRPIPDMSAPVRSVRIQGGGKGSLPQPMSVQADMDGKVCTKLPPGSYTLQVVVTEMEARSGLKFVPDSRDIEVVDGPLSGIVFNQFSANVKGRVKCLQPQLCEGVKVQLKHVESKKSELVTVTAGSFAFGNVLPGEYRVTVVRDDWCWDQKMETVHITDKDLEHLAFEQTGYIMKVSSSHPTTLSYFFKKRKEGERDIEKGDNHFCVSGPGIYSFSTAASCHDFSVEDVTFNTADPKTVTLKAKRHLLSGFVTAEVNATDITVTVKTSRKSSQDITETLGPLKAVAREADTFYRYGFSLWATPGDLIEFTANSDQLLFSPRRQTVTVIDGCMPDAVRLAGKKGVFVQGTVTPILEKVKIVVTAVDGSVEPITVFTDREGQYRVGPLHDTTAYEVSAERQGYVMSKGKELGDFEAFKLAEVIVAVADESGEKLVGALLSLSGDGDYRQNSVTQDDGKMVFSGLSPGQYFIRPMMKEFKFEPQSKMFDLKEGATVDIRFTGHRVAFSCYGTVTSLAGEPEGRVVIEAAGEEGCESSHEEAVTEPDGSFRIRGLQPQCDYKIVLKKSQDVNQHIERIVPTSKTIQIQSSDVTGVSLVVFRPVSYMDLSGNIDTGPEYLSSLKVILTKDDSDHALHTVNIVACSFFQLPMIPLDNSHYTLSLASSLSRNMYEFDTPEIGFRANSTYRHFAIKFVPRPKSSEHDANQGSYLALPLAILAVLAVANHSKLLPLINQAGDFFQNVSLAGPVRTFDTMSVSETVTAKKKLKPRKT